MSEDDDLKRRIAQLSGQINRQEQADSHISNHHGLHVARGRRGNGSSYASGYAYKATARGAPYPRGRPSRGRASSVPHKNRTLILNNQANSAKQLSAQAVSDTGDFSTDPGVGSAPGQPAVGWVAKHDRHKQLINTAVYEREVQTRARDMEESRQKKARLRDERERAKFARHMQRLASHGASSTAQPTQSMAAPASYEITVQGIRFRVTHGGGRLMKLNDDLGSTRPTPKKATIGGVTFLRSKNGNLYRSGAVKAQSLRRGNVKKLDEPCQRFSSTGSCARGPECRYRHDSNEVAICKTFLQSGTCPAGDACDLSHEPSPERVPACLHFVKGNCSNDHCRYAHVRVNPGAPVCRRFAHLGFCKDGARCAERHVHECPDYAKTGSCANRKCRLPHIDRAGQIRKNQQATSLAGAPEKVNGHVTVGEEDESDLSSDDDHSVDSDDVDSDDLTEELMIPQAGLGSQDVSAQTDFIRF